ncbi:hypothetical protein [Chryseobacterium sp. POL2]|uniref:hypothetical protein n=1 Tax=Chryseobacterium sp. POL2 TaxID=2713414 RepID=UPI0013E17A29|nr:hypothetical protein [Chryseobacterium sp. POL2]QIG90152.1 hypothetical protein G6R40_10990 [Chryseobacterium sp. POL2]
MKYLSILVLAIFMNFTALPSMAAIFGWDLPTTNVSIAEEEVKTGSSSFNEKVTSNPLSIHDFVKFFESDLQNKSFDLINDGASISPYIPIFSPPPNRI